MRVNGGYFSAICLLSLKFDCWFSILSQVCLTFVVLVLKRVPSHELSVFDKTANKQLRSEKKVVSMNVFIKVLLRSPSFLNSMQKI